jgi:tetratricopeptide (TPR) repeat protein
MLLLPSLDNWCEIPVSPRVSATANGRKLGLRGEVSRLRRRSAVNLRGQGYLVSWPRQAERPVDREQLRRRVLAFAGIWFLLAGMLAALGFSIFLLASLALLLLGGIVVAGLWLMRRHEIGQGLRSARGSIERASRKVGSSLDELNAPHRLGRLASDVAQQARSALEPRQRKPTAHDPRREALRLNELGAQHRRGGEYEQAAEQHRRALAIVRELGDEPAEALTLNNLALALVHTGGVTVAVEHFEEALALLRDLGDEEHEGQVIANLGFVRRRQGRDEDARSLLNEALDKLPPESPAYRHVEEQLRRAS